MNSGVPICLPQQTNAMGSRPCPGRCCHHIAPAPTLPWPPASPCCWSPVNTEVKPCFYKNRKCGLGTHCRVQVPTPPQLPQEKISKCSPVSLERQRKQCSQSKTVWVDGGDWIPDWNYDLKQSRKRYVIMLLTINITLMVTGSNYKRRQKCRPTLPFTQY